MTPYAIAVKYAFYSYAENDPTGVGEIYDLYQIHLHVSACSLTDY